jgi:hypothetical protein
MNKNYYVNKFRYKFKLPKTAQFIFFRNPKEFSYTEIERINPDHKLIIWGILRRKYRHCKKAYKIKLGKINIPILLFIFAETIYIDRNVLPDNLPLMTMYMFFSIFYVYCTMYLPFNKAKTC